MLAVARMRARAEWRRSRVSLLALTLLIAIAGAVAFTALAGARRTHATIGAFDRANLSASFYIELGEPDSYRGAAEIAALPEVAAWTLYAVPTVLPVGEYLPTLAPVDDSGGTRLERGLVIDGRRPRDDAPDEIALPVAQATQLHARVGDEIPFVRFDKEQARRCLYAESGPPDCQKIFLTPAFKMRVVGVVRTGTDLVNRARDVSLSFTTPAFYARYRDAALWTPAVMVKLRPGVSDEQFDAAVRRVVPAGVDPVLNRPNKSSFTDALNVLAAGLALFGAVAGLAGALAIGQAVRRQALRSAADDATLAALGATRRSRACGIVAVFVPVVLLGSALAMGAALLASSRMPIGLARRADPGGHLEFDLMVLGGGVLLVGALVLGVAASAAWRTGRAAGTPASEAAIGAHLSTAINDPRASIGLQYATVPGKGSNAVPVRAAFLATATAVAGVISVLAFAAGLHHLVHTPSMYGWKWNVVVNNDHREAVLADPDVGPAAEIVAQLPLRVKGISTLAMSVTPIRGDIGPAIVSGRAPATRDEIALGSKTMSAAHVGIGDLVSVAGADGELRMRVVGRGVFPTTTDAYPLADGAYVTPAAVKVFGGGDAQTENIISRGIAVAYRPGADPQAVYARMTAIDTAGESGATPPDRAAPPAEVENLQRVEDLPVVLAGFLAVLGLVAVAHALIVGVRRRARELATLRVLGFRPRDVGLTVAWQASILAIAGALVGIPIGVVVGRLAWSAVAHRVGVLVVHRLPVGALVAVIPFTLMVAVAAAVLPARRAARLRPAEILRSE